MKINSKLKIIVIMICLVNIISFTSALLVNSNFITIYPGEEGKITMALENNENFDIQDVSVSLVLEDLQFTIVGDNEKNADDLDKDDGDKVSFLLKSFTDITPGDYNIPYKIKYTNSDTDELLTKEGVFGLRVSAKTEIDFSAEINDGAIVGEKGKITVEIINKGLGKIKAVSVKILPNGFDLLSTDKIFIGTINSEDTDIASYDVLFTSSKPILSATIDYKDFDNKDQIQSVNIPLKVFTKEEALEKGLLQKSKVGFYFGLIIGIILIWIIYIKIKKRKKNKKNFNE